MVKNIIVLMLDTVRADALYDRINAPNIAAMISHGSVYNNTVAPGTWTAPTHAALFVNRQVSSIKEVSQDFLKNDSIDPWMVKTKFLESGSETLATKMSNLGYYTVLVSNNPFLTSDTNLAIGFNKVYDSWRHTNVKYNSGLANHISKVIDTGSNGRKKMYDAAYLISKMIPAPILDKVYLDLRMRMDRQVAVADGTNRLDRGISDSIKTIEHYAENTYNHMPQFMFINIIEAHENYPLAKNDAIVQDKWLYLSDILQLDDYISGKLHGAYIKRVRYLDKKIKHMIDTLKVAGMLDDTVVVITSDHGQLFGEHGMLYHAVFPYEGLAKVPLIAVQYKNGRMIRQAEQVNTPVSLNSLHDALIDIASGKHHTLNGNMRTARYVTCEHMGISEGWDIQLLEKLRGRSRYADALYRAKKKHNIKACAIYQNNAKLIHYFGKKADELYDVGADPSESENIIHANRGIAKGLLRQLTF